MLWLRIAAISWERYRVLSAVNMTRIVSSMGGEG